MYYLLGVQPDPGLVGAAISAEEWQIFDGDGKLRQTTTCRKRAKEIVQANKHMGAYALSGGIYEKGERIDPE